MVAAYEKVFDEPVVLMNDFQKMFSQLDEICDYSATAFNFTFIILYANAIMEMKKLAEYKEKHLRCNVFTINVNSGLMDKFEESYFKN